MSEQNIPKIIKNGHEGEAIVRDHVYWSVAGGLIPVPLLDIASVTAIQLDMLKELCALYQVDFKRSQMKAWITALSGSSLASVGASLVKSIPGVGSLIGGVSMSILSGASTHAIGQVFCLHFSSGGNLENFHADHFKDYYKQKFEEGKRIAEQVKNKLKEKMHKEGNREDDMVSRLEKLAKLRDQGNLSQAEYERLKADIIRKYSEG